MPTVVCVARGVDEIDHAIEQLNEAKVQLLLTKFPVGSGTFKRNKFVSVQYIGPSCSIVKRGQGINEINAFADSHLHGVPSLSTTDKQSLSFESLVQQLKNVFVSDNGNFSLEQIRNEYKSRMTEERKKMHQEAAADARAQRSKQRAQLSKSVTLQAMAIASRANELANSDARAASGGNGKSSSSSNNNNSEVTPQQRQQQMLQRLSLHERNEVTQRVLAALRQDHGAVNWAVFAAEPVQLRVTAYGRGGIFELVKNLPEDQWLFGLFRISFFTGEERQRRMIFFQWIGSNLKPVRNGHTAGIYPNMAKALAPFAYEIYLVGQNDLQPQAIISKSKNAFNPPRHRHDADAAIKDAVLRQPVFTEESYRESLLDEQAATKDVDFEVFQNKDKLRRPPQALERSLASMPVEPTRPNTAAQQLYDVNETIALVQSEEGGLMWAIFEVR